MRSSILLFAILASAFPTAGLRPPPGQCRLVE